MLSKNIKVIIGLTKVISLITLVVLIAMIATADDSRPEILWPMVVLLIISLYDVNALVYIARWTNHESQRYLKIRKILVKLSLISKIVSIGTFVILVCVVALTDFCEDKLIIGFVVLLMCRFNFLPLQFYLIKIL